jgi:hypothetical protein
MNWFEDEDDDEDENDAAAGLRHSRGPRFRGSMRENLGEI